jgi:hypothetical protein
MSSVRDVRLRGACVRSRMAVGLDSSAKTPAGVMSFSTGPKWYPSAIFRSATRSPSKLKTTARAEYARCAYGKSGNRAERADDLVRIARLPDADPQRERRPLPGACAPRPSGTRSSLDRSVRAQHLQVSALAGFSRGVSGGASLLRRSARVGTDDHRQRLSTRGHRHEGDERRSHSPNAWRHHPHGPDRGGPGIVFPLSWSKDVARSGIRRFAMTRSATYATGYGQEGLCPFHRAHLPVCALVPSRTYMKALSVNPSDDAERPQK